MSTKKTKFADCGIIVGRFQVNSLTEAHIKLIQTVLERHSKVIIFLGVSGISPVPSTKRNPLDFEIRKQMLEQEFPADNIIISHVTDMKSDTNWSKELDKKIKDLVSPNQSVVLYGSRDSFIKHYSGKFTTEDLQPEVYFANVSGEELRNRLKVRAEASDMFRAGVIWANENQYKHAIAAVGVAVFNDDYTKILLGRKEYETHYEMFGGFTDISDEDYETTAKREVFEETGIEIEDLRYVCSGKVNDWRYKNESDKIYTTIFSARYIFGSITPADDIIECKWFDLYEDGKPSEFLITTIRNNFADEFVKFFDAVTDNLIIKKEG